MAGQRNRKVKGRTRKRVRRNVRQQKQGFIFPTPLATILSVATVLCLAYLWLCGRNEALAGDIRRLELDLEKARKDVVNEEFKWAAKITPENLQRQIRRHNIDMDWPQAEQVVEAGGVDRWVVGDPEEASRLMHRADVRP